MKKSKLILISLILVASILFLSIGNSRIKSFSLTTRVSNMSIIQGNSLPPLSVPYLMESKIYVSLIDCLAEKESSNNPLAINPNDPNTPSFGLLQFKRQTFNHFCVDKYNFRDDIWDAEIQRACCDSMIKDGYLNHWSTAKFCK